MRRNARRIDSAVPKPQAAATESTPCADSSRRRRAASTRTDSTKRAGVIPTSRVKTRAKFRGLIATRRAIGGLRGELSAELRLAARAPQKHHELTRDLERELATVVLLDECQRQVHAG